jgi:hypothetical protein
LIPYDHGKFPGFGEKSGVPQIEKYTFLLYIFPISYQTNACCGKLAVGILAGHYGIKLNW